jgi:sulfoxide reductase heme-binding subunit YedZ
VVISLGRHAGAPAVHGAEADQPAPHARRRGVLLCVFTSLLYVVQEKFDLARWRSEIVFRVYLTIGFVALLGLIALAATSTDGMIRAARRRALEPVAQACLPVAFLGIIQFLMQTKLDISESVMVGGFLIWLLGYRLMQRYAGVSATCGRSRSRCWPRR